MSLELAGRWLQRHSTKVLAGAVLLGLLWQDLAGLLRPVVTPLAVAAMTLACLRLDWQGLGAYLRRPRLVLFVLLWVLVGAPVVVHALSWLFLPSGSPLRAGLLLNAATPPLLSSPAYALILGIEPALPMVISMLGTALAPLSAPAVVGALAGTSLEVPAGALLVRLLGVVAVVLGGAALLKRLLGRERIEAGATMIDGLVVLLIASFGIGLMDGLSAILTAQPSRIALYVLLAFALNIGLQLLGGLLLYWRDRQQGLALALLSGNRNLSMMLAAIVDVVELDVALFIICGQFPLFLLPLVMRPLVARLR